MVTEHHARILVEFDGGPADGDRDMLDVEVNTVRRAVFGNPPKPKWTGRDHYYARTDEIRVLNAIGYQVYKHGGEV